MGALRVSQRSSKRFADVGSRTSRPDALMDELVQRVQAPTLATGAVLEVAEQDDPVSWWRAAR